jgi:hypothetical protein
MGGRQKRERTEKNFWMSAFNDYLTELGKNLIHGDSTEHTHRPALKKLLESVGQGIIATNEPTRILCGAPDFNITKGKVPLGHVETKDIGENQRRRVEENARAVLTAREPHLLPRCMGALAGLYDPLAMPAELLKAHAELDRAVENCYRAEPFHPDRERVEFLFSLYEKLTAPLLPVTPKPAGRRSQSAKKTLRPTRQRTPALPGQIAPGET